VYLFLEKYKSKAVYNSQLRHFFKFCVEKNLISDVEYKKLRQIKLRNEKSYNLDPYHDFKWSISQNRWEEVYSQLGNLPAKMAVWIGFNFGLRVGEILNLTRRDVNLNKGELLITSENKPVQWQPKTRKSVRKLYITKKQNEFFRNYFYSRDTNWDYPYVIYPQKIKKTLERPLSRTWLATHFKRVKIHIPGLGVKTLRPHVLRYSFATHLYYNTSVSDKLQIISRILGHEKITETEKYLRINEYELLHLCGEAMENAGL
jgi:integrase